MTSTGAKRPADSPSHIALIGNSLPRRCGIATFTSDTFDALRASFPEMTIDLYAMDDDTGVEYPPEIRTIAQNDPAAYRDAARTIEASGAQAIWLQHEYGIFGGSAGDHILKLLERTTLPLLVTLHTVLEHPGPEERRVLEALVRRASKLIVMAEKGRALLLSVYGVSDDLIEVIPHGVPDRPFVETATLKPRFGFEGHDVILTFGLLAPDKGIEGMIEAMPEIVAAHPSALYVVLGATHPNLARREGESYRDKLLVLAASRGVSDHVRFIDAFVEQAELLDYLQAADVYVTPYVKRDQITSGTLSYAVAVGKPVVSTPYIHATEILADDHGRLVDFHDSAALAREVSALLADSNARGALAARAYARGRTMLWSRLAERAVAIVAGMKTRTPARIASRPSMRALKPNITAVLRMSDATGMLQHGIYSVPDRNHGYCIDDNARALILMCRMPEMDEEERDRWTSTYASFLNHGWNPDKNKFRNFMSFDRQWMEDEGSEDSNGRTLWALGVAARDARAQKHRDWAAALFNRTAAALVPSLEAPRARAFAMIAAAAMSTAYPGHALSQDIMARFGDELLALLAESRRPDWSWFEAVLAYDNARLSEALLRAGLALGRQDYIDCGIATLEWIVGQQTAPEGHFRAVGTDSFGRPYAPPLPFDQQPLEAQATIDACEAALAATGDRRWIEEAERAYRWFLGRNDLDLPMASAADGGCYDGLMPAGLNRNQGAESILALQLASATISTLSNVTPAMAEKRDAA